MQFIYYPKCSTCQKALKQLKKQELDVELRDIVLDTPTKDELICWMNQYGIRSFFNTSGKIYREMKLKDKVNDLSMKEAAELLSSNGILIKRPLLIMDDEVIIEYKKEVYEK
ncbi:MAG: Spx/MgsR family RNA polymerase-binding regulatory protein [Erysipelotrichaceae bacterium]|nr:Spx/MgsR family RNA polymerase-binding regulatory protein [Erysipelotrichaceae bacterium]